MTLAELMAETIEAHRHERVVGGYVACVCREPWDSHKAHVANELALAAVQWLEDQIAADGWCRGCGRQSPSGGAA